MADDRKKVPDANRDPLTGAPGAHPLGTGAGAAAGGAAGAAAGAAAAGPPGAVVGAAIGAVVGGLAGKGAAEAVNPTVENAYWKENYVSRPYVSGEPYDVYQPAYQHGWESYGRYQGRDFDEAEEDVRRDWETNPHAKHLPWERAREATRDAWHRVERALPGDADGDGI
jgi:hypothetical protein